MYYTEIVIGNLTSYFKERTKGEEMTRVYFDGITEMGCSIKNAMVTVSDDWTMNEIVEAIKDQRYIFFKLPTMKCYAPVYAPARYKFNSKGECFPI